MTSRNKADPASGRGWQDGAARIFLITFASVFSFAATVGRPVFAASALSGSASAKTSAAKDGSAAKASRGAARSSKAGAAATAAPASGAKSAGAGNVFVPESSPLAGVSIGNSHEPINIRSDSLSLDYKAKSVLFTGHVHAVQAGGELTSSTLTVLYGNDFHDIKQMVADGNVRMSQGTRWATGDHAVLDEAEHTVVLTGSPVVHDGPDQITGSRITVHLDTGRSVVQQARAVIFPRKSETPDNKSVAGNAK